MNKELIQKFLNKACYDGQDQYELEDWLNVEKFAELIMQECMFAVENHGGMCGAASSKKIKEHFGVEE